VAAITRPPLYHPDIWSDTVGEVAGLPSHVNQRGKCGVRHNAKSDKPSRIFGVVQIRVTRETWSPLVGAALATFGVTHKPPVLNHASLNDAPGRSTSATIRSFSSPASDDAAQPR